MRQFIGHSTTKPTKWYVPQQIFRSAWASAQSDQSLRSAFNREFRAQCFFMRTVKTLIRLGECPGWSESSLGTQVILLISSCSDSNYFVSWHLKRICETINMQSWMICITLINFLAFKFTILCTALIVSKKKVITPTHEMSLMIQEIIMFDISLDTRKPVFGVCDQVRHKPACAATEAR